jgi:hypothetical protein
MPSEMLPQFPAMLGSSGDEPKRRTQKAPCPENILHKKTKEKTKHYCRASTDDDKDDGLATPNPRGHDQMHRPPSRALG